MRVFFRCMVRVKSANGNTATSHPYHPSQGGCQGSVWMPLLFVVLAHYTYRKCDPGRVGLYGVGEQSDTSKPRCDLCEEKYDEDLLPTRDGYCRACQILQLKRDEMSQLTMHGRPKDMQAANAPTKGTRRVQRLTGRPQPPERELFDTFDVDRDGLQCGRNTDSDRHAAAT